MEFVTKILHLFNPATFSIVLRTTTVQVCTPLVVDSDGVARWVVESLAEHRDPPASSGHEREFLVRWRGFDPADATWEPRSTLSEDIPDLVAEYERKLLRRT